MLPPTPLAHLFMSTPPNLVGKSIYQKVENKREESWAWMGRAGIRIDGRSGVSLKEMSTFTLCLRGWRGRAR